MKRIRFVSSIVLLLFLGSVAPTYALQEQHEQEAKPEKQEQQAKPERQQQQQKQSQQAKPEKQQQQKAPQQAKGQEQQKQPQQAKQQKASQQTKPTQQAKRAPEAKPVEKQTVQQRKPAPQQKTQQSRANVGNSGGAHGRISDEHYRASFGDSHRFHVSGGDYRNHRFQWGGYSFGFVDPWPAGWLYTDYVYVEYIDGGYYMFDALHPGIRISINIL